ncbi:MAG: pitrilysin family protein [Owenweeksia sp.]
MKKEFEVFELPNGIRFVHRYVNRPVGHCGLMIQAGSRDETPETEGLAHFIEHILFKGTRKRKAFHILSRMEDVGGELNAYTSKEDTVIYASFLGNDYQRAIELIFDIGFHSTFPEKELVKEKEVIIDEINSYKDSPSELIFDDYEAQLFPNHSLGMNILGTPETVRSFKRQDVLNFLDSAYGTQQMVFSYVGHIKAPRILAFLQKITEDIPARSGTVPRSTPHSYQPSRVESTRPVFQNHVITGNRAYAAGDEKSRTLHLLNNLLGGPGMNSRLNLNIREKYGFTYNIESFYTPYSDTGVFGIYAGTDPATIGRTLKLIEKELRKLREKKLGTIQLSKAKRQILGQIAMAQENNVSLMLALGKSLLTFDRIDTFDEVREKIENITAEDLIDVANEILAPEQLSTLIYKPT